MFEARACAGLSRRPELTAEPSLCMHVHTYKFALEVIMQIPLTKVVQSCLMECGTSFIWLLLLEYKGNMNASFLAFAGKWSFSSDGEISKELEARGEFSPPHGRYYLCERELYKV